MKLASMLSAVTSIVFGIYQLYILSKGFDFSSIGVHSLLMILLFFVPVVIFIVMSFLSPLPLRILIYSIITYIGPIFFLFSYSNSKYSDQLGLLINVPMLWAGAILTFIGLISANYKRNESNADISYEDTDTVDLSKMVEAKKYAKKQSHF